jgi:hypothetical protein
MKLLARTALPAALLTSLLLFGCDKPDGELVISEPQPPITSVTEFHRVFTPPTQVFQLNPGQAQNVTLIDGTVLFFPARAYELLTGGVATGPVEVRVQGMIKPVDMVLGGLPTMSFWRPLETGGQFHITAWQNSTVPLRLRPGYGITLSVPRAPTTSLTGMTLWTGIRTVGTSLTWLQDTARVRTDGVPGGQQYLQTQLRTDSLGWYNLGRLWTSNPADTTQLRADVGGDPAARVYVLPTQRSGAFMMKWNSQTRLMELYGVPAGTDLKVIVLKTQNGELLVGTEHTVLRRGMVFRLPLQPMTVQAAADRIRQF